MDPATGGVLDSTGDVLSWDVFTETIAGIRHPGAVNPLPGMKVRHVVGLGESQSALRLTPYYNSIDPLYHVVDGIVYYDASGQLRSDSPTKAISVATEIGVGLHPDGTPPTDTTNTRRWEMSGYASDSKGDTTGGIQLAEYGYGSAISKGAGTTGPGFCWLTGAHHFLTADELSARYPDPNEYLRDALRLTTRNVRQGFLLPGDAAQTIAGVLRIYRQLLQAGNA